MVRGDGTLGSYAIRGRAVGRHRFRLALVDLEALGERSATSLNSAWTDEFLFQRRRRDPRGIAIAAPSGAVERGPRAHRLAVGSDAVLAKGFLAGIFDAEGSCSGSLRISNTDTAIIEQTTTVSTASVFATSSRTTTGRTAFDASASSAARPSNCGSSTQSTPRSRASARSKGGRSSSPAICESLDRAARARDPDVRHHDRTGDFIANGVVSHNCFARPTHEYLDLNAGRDFEREIIVKVNVPEVLRVELARPSWGKERVALGTNTDPYQWVEGRYKLMRGIWEAFRDFKNPCSILTKSPLLLRDLDLMKEIAKVTEISACLSVPTLDEKAWRATEPHTPHPRARLEAVADSIATAFRPAC